MTRNATLPRAGVSFLLVSVCLLVAGCASGARVGPRTADIPRYACHGSNIWFCDGYDCQCVDRESLRRSLGW